MNRAINETAAIAAAIGLFLVAIVLIGSCRGQGASDVTGPTHIVQLEGLRRALDCDARVVCYGITGGFGMACVQLAPTAPLSKVCDR
jgi:hypothetical protein